MKLQRFTEILEAYGGNSQRWPEAERTAALELCAAEPEARRLMEETLTLDLLLDSYELPQGHSQTLAQKIESRTQPAPTETSPGPETPGFIDQVITWMTPDPGSLPSLFRPALVACLPVLLGIWIGTGESTTDELTLAEEYAVLAVFTPSESEGF